MSTRLIEVGEEYRAPVMLDWKPKWKLQTVAAPLLRILIFIYPPD
jgi:hypothetical protein